MNYDILLNDDQSETDSNLTLINDEPMTQEGKILAIQASINKKLL